MSGWQHVPTTSVRHCCTSTLQIRDAYESSRTVVLTLEKAINLDTCIIDLGLSKNGELHIERRKVQFRHFFNELLRAEVDIILVGLKPARSHRGRNTED